MRRAVLWLSSLGVAAASCLAVLSLLREPPGPAPASEAPAAEPVRSERIAAPPAPPPAAPTEARRLEDAARAAETEEQALRDAILGVAADESLPLAARLERYRDAVAAARQRTPDAPLDHPGMLTEAFLRADAVQSELAALSPAARARELAHIRRTLGFAEEEIARMEQIDAWRESRWQNGLAYMAERERISGSFEGEALDDELGALRAEYFGHEAPTIEAEERDGFYRFQRPRVYGRN
jgi:hypothetical protein